MGQLRCSNVLNITLFKNTLEKVIFDTEHKQQFDFLFLTEMENLSIMPSQAFHHLHYSTPQQIWFRNSVSSALQ